MFQSLIEFFLMIPVTVASSERINQNLHEVVSVIRIVEWSSNFINREGFLENIDVDVIINDLSC
ncbi:hypothetical protein EPI10_007023 [Gossypium australe]|uniref:Uncharacterized protein n=1 Tax=Gossypium australe TaxID=47621 RepID=A0A5B6WTZ5_9ROSI|nr:hypothetical protein EPI10_007023 [Gossypium australe]